MNRAERRRRNRKVAKKYRQPWREDSFPSTKRGAWEGIKEIRKLYERKERAKVRDSLKIGQEPEPTKNLSNAKYEYF